MLREGPASEALRLVAEVAQTAASRKKAEAEITRAALVASNRASDRLNQATEAVTGLAAAHEVLKEDQASEALRLEAEAAQTAASRKKAGAEITRAALVASNRASDRLSQATEAETGLAAVHEALNEDPASEVLRLEAEAARTTASRKKAETEITCVVLVASNRPSQGTEAETVLAAVHEALEEDPANEVLRLEAEAAQTKASRKKAEADITRAAMVASNRFNQATEAETVLAAAHEALKEDPANEAFRLEAEVWLSSI